MRKILFLLILLFSIAQISIAQHKNFTLRSRTPFKKFATGITDSISTASVWGYVDNNRREYALVGTYEGVAIVDVTDPDKPKVIQNVPHTQSEWRELKTYKQYCYATNENGGGVLLIDLSSLPNQVVYKTLTFGNKIKRAHALWVDEHDKLYLFGANRRADSTYIFDLKQTPNDPAYIGAYKNAYVHDGFVRGDTLWASEIYNGNLSIVNLKNPQAPEVLGSVRTPLAFTHNSHVTSNNKYMFTTDERSNSLIAAYDVSNVKDIKELDRIQANPGSNSIAHNVHLVNDTYMYAAYYTDGAVLYDVSRPDNMVEVGNYDTSDKYKGDGYYGCWGVYPYLPSGNILASDMQNGLYVITPKYQRACWLEGVVRDSVSKQPILGANVEIATTWQKSTSNRDGIYKTGWGTSGTYKVTIQKTGYYPKTITISLENGKVTAQDIVLRPINQQVVEGVVLDSISDKPIANASVYFIDATNTYIYNVITNANGSYNFKVAEGKYNFYIGKWGYKTKGFTQNFTGGTSLGIPTKLSPGYYDDFILNFSWIVPQLPANSGAWNRTVPKGSLFKGRAIFPEKDVTDDLGNMAMITGNGVTDSPGTDDVDISEMKLISPTFDVATYKNPTVRFAYWFINSGDYPPNDSLKVLISNGTERKKVAFFTCNANTPSVWTTFSFKIKDFITPSTSMTIEFITGDDAANPNLVVAGIDKFEVFEGAITPTADVATNHHVTVSPNPFKNNVIIAYDLPSEIKTARLEIIDITGKLLLTQALKDQKGTVSLGENLLSGVYFVKILDEKSQLLSVKRMVKGDW
jgi:choice-of-anchor B domain-containing protein